MAQSKTSELRDKTEAVYEKVAGRDGRQSVLDALKRVEEVVAKADGGEALRAALSVETAHLKDVIGAQAKLQETVGTLIAGYDALTSALGGEIHSMKEMTL